ncbi:MAG TPA: ABC transporter substrate-binding protein [Thermomicrobiales bacterium]|nr:ABC transporter substrate-binding protein [Thermomicrobiales bacterium]
MIQSTDAIVLLVTGHMYETLFTWDGDYLPVPLLAESHEVSDDGLLITLRLRGGVPFHNGEVMDADDVIASIGRWERVVGIGELLLGHVDAIIAVDQHTIEFRLNAPYGTFAVALARGLQGCAIHPKSVLDRSDDYNLAEPIGTGPYRFVGWQPDRHIQLERFAGYASTAGDPDGYAGRKARYLDGIEFVPVRNEASRLAGLQAGDYHYLETVSPDHYPTLLDDPNVAVDLLPPDSWLSVVLNMRSPVLASLDVRRAIQLALDHEPIMQAAFGEGFFELTPTLLPGADAWHSDAGAEHFNQRRPDVARELLQQSGYDGSPLRFLTTQEIQQEYNGTLVMAQQLETIGFTVDVQVLDGAALSAARNDEGRWEMYSAWASFRPDPTMRNITASATGWWEDEAKDQLLADLGAELDFGARFAIWEQVQHLFYEQVPRLKIGDSRRILVRSPKLRGAGPDELQPDFSNAWLEG